MFDTAISAEQAIKRGTTKIANDTGDESFNQIAAEIESVVPTTNAKTDEIADFSSDVDNFIKNFQSQSALGASTYTPRKAPAVIKNSQVQEPAAESVKADEKEEEQEEKNEGFSDWMKIMNDVDDDEPEEERHHKRKKSKKNKKQRTEKAASQEETQEEKNEEQAENEMQEMKEEADASFEGPLDFDYEDNDEGEKEDMLIESKKKSKQKKEKSKKEEADENEKPKKSKSSKGRIAARVVLSLFMVVSLFATLAVGSLNTVLNINTGKESFGGYVLFTAAYDFDEVSVKANDLVVCKSGYALNGDRVVYIDRENKLFSFGTKTAVKTNSDGKIVQIIGTQEVEEENVIGSISKTISSLGGYISLVFENYVLILSTLCAVTVLLAFVVIYVLRNKNKVSKKLEKEDVQESENDEEIETSSEEADEDIDEDEGDEEDEDGESANLFSDLE